MNFTISNTDLLKPLSIVCGIPSQELVLLDVNDNNLLLMTNNGTIQMSATALCDSTINGTITVSSKKLLDVCKKLPANSILKFDIANGKMSLKTGRSKYTLVTLPADHFPQFKIYGDTDQFTIPVKLIKDVQFSMANKDVRYFLNGVYLDVDQLSVKAVATDGHRLAVSEMQASNNITQGVIIPRETAAQITKLIHPSDDVNVNIDKLNIIIKTPDFTMTSTTIDGRYPDYRRVIPTKSNKKAIINRQDLKQALTRAIICANDKFRGVKLKFHSNTLSIEASNPDQDNALEEIEIDYNYPDLEIGVNANYLLDVVNANKTEVIELNLTDGNTSILIDNDGVKCVVMPMRL